MFTSIKYSIKYLILVGAATAAVIVPSSAYARPALYQPPGDASFVSQSTAPAAPEHQAAATPSFSWHDAGFGAAGALVLVAIGTGAALAMRRRTILS